MNSAIGRQTPFARVAGQPPIPIHPNRFAVQFWEII
jgi:hypothetical protein